MASLGHNELNCKTNLTNKIETMLFFQEFVKWDTIFASSFFKLTQSPIWYKISTCWTWNWDKFLVIYIYEINTFFLFHVHYINPNAIPRWIPHSRCIPASASVSKYVCGPGPGTRGEFLYKLHTPEFTWQPFLNPQSTDPISTHWPLRYAAVNLNCNFQTLIKDLKSWVFPLILSTYEC